MRIGGAEDSRLVVRTLASNRRVVCAAPSYLARRELLQSPADLARTTASSLGPITAIWFTIRSTRRVEVRAARSEA